MNEENCSHIIESDSGGPEVARCALPANHPGDHASLGELKAQVLNRKTESRTLDVIAGEAAEECYFKADGQDGALSILRGIILSALQKATEPLEQALTRVSEERDRMKAERDEHAMARHVRCQQRDEAEAERDKAIAEMERIRGKNPDLTVLNEQ